MSAPDPLVDLTDAELRARGSFKWTHPEPDVLPAWVAETDLAVSARVTEALADAVRRGETGYPGFDHETGVPESFAAYAAREWGWTVDPASVVLTGDVMSGVELALRSLCEDAPVVVFTPSYPPFLDVVPLTGRELVTIPLDPDAEVAALDLDRLDAALAGGARTVLLCNPHNPWGRAFTSDELTDLRDVVLRHGARVVSDEIHGPLVLPGVVHVPYATLPGAAEHTVTVTSASKAWNVAGLKCAQVVAGSAADLAALRAVPHIANHGLSSLGVVANRAAYDEGGPWLEAFVDRVAANVTLLRELLAHRLPDVRVRPMEATYLAWLDVRALGLDDPYDAALRRGRVMVYDGRHFGPGGEGHVRVNLATSAARVTEVVERLGRAWLG